METKEKESWTDLAEFKPNNLGQAWKLADILSKTSFSAGHKSAQDIFICISMGQQIGLNPFQAVQNISVINGRPTLWGDALVAVCQSHPEYAGVEMSFDEESQTATCKALRKGKPRWLNHSVKQKLNKLDYGVSLALGHSILQKC